jgi:hypothetical protein
VSGRRAALGLLLIAAAAAPAIRPGTLQLRAHPLYLLADPADLSAFALRGANAAHRLPGRPDEPRAVRDPDRFAAGLDAGAVPADRFYLEYPPPALALFRLETALAGVPDLPPAAADAEHTDVAAHTPRTPAETAAWARLSAAARLHVLLMGVALVGLLWALRDAPGWWLVLLPGCVYFGLNRYDVLPALAVAVALRVVDRRPGGAGALLAFGAGLKLFPALFLPVLVRLAGWRVAAGFLLAGAAIAAGCLLTVGVEGTLAPLRVQLGRPPELGSWTLYGRLLPTALAYSPAARLVILFTVVAACAVRKPADLSSAVRRCGLILLTFTQLAVFWSPQWLVWFVPLAAGLGTRTATAMAAVDVCGYLSFPVLFHLGWGELPADWRQPTAEGLILVRTAAWGWLGWRFLTGEPTRGGFDLAAVRRAARPPRGLNWVGIEPAGEPVIRPTRALVPVTVRFDPQPGGGLDDVPQARDPRPAVAVFVPRAGRWVPTGKLVFNLPLDAIPEGS